MPPLVGSLWRGSLRYQGRRVSVVGGGVQRALRAQCAACGRLKQHTHAHMHTHTHAHSHAHAREVTSRMLDAPWQGDLLGEPYAPRPRRPGPAACPPPPSAMRIDPRPIARCVGLWPTPVPLLPGCVCLDPQVEIASQVAAGLAYLQRQAPPLHLTGEFSSRRYLRPGRGYTCAGVRPASNRRLAARRRH